ncbi:unnamed protein product [Lactuca virosa]|uniref:Apple domain-containing protein n=1 Tax=Lactuca virosa TaxID=75947 RepID=A0AAU9NUC2_9ASTR|nr:unnamed protein product [Lactuca virosa]
MNSTISATNFSGGRFQLRLLQDGNLLLNTRNILSGNPLVDYYRSGTSAHSNSTNSSERVIFDAMGYMYILRRNGERLYLTQRGSVPSGDYYHRATLDSDGVFRQYYYPKNSTGNASWEVVLYIPDNICEDIRGNIDSGAYFTPSCYHEGKSNNGGDVLGFIELNNTDWVFSDHGNLDPSSEQTCKSICLEDCFCAVAIYRDAKCWKKRLPLSNEIMSATDNMKAFVKYWIADGPFQNPHRPPRERKDKISLILVVSVLLGMSVFVIFVLIGVICVGFLVIYKKKPRNTYPIRKAVESNLPHFTYQELVEATYGFKDELGKGAFGIVYKEIVSCRKSLAFETDDKGVMVLTNLAWDCYQEGRLDAFVENDLEALNNHKKLATFVMVGLWCVQENSSLRPTMRKVIQMLDGVIDVAKPPCPCSFLPVIDL